MVKSYIVDICGRKEELPVIELPNKVGIAFFNLHGNPGLTEFCAQELAKKIAGYKPDIIITAESKGLQLAHCLARNLGHNFYAVARKSQKLYMVDGISVIIKSITTGHEQSLYLSKHDVSLIKGKKVAIIDDVVSTGGSLKGMEELVSKAGGQVVCKAFVLAEDIAADRNDIIYLGRIPLFK